MYSQNVKVFQTANLGSELVEAFRAFEEMWDLMDSSVPKLPNCLVTGDFPPTNLMVDKDENLVIQMAVAGYPEEGIDMNFKDDYLTIGLTPDEKVLEGYKVKMRGIRNSKAERKIYVPSKDFDLAKTEASTKNGILTIAIPRKEEAKPISIKVKSK